MKDETAENMLFTGLILGTVVALMVAFAGLGFLAVAASHWLWGTAFSGEAIGLATVMLAVAFWAFHPSRFIRRRENIE